jgi:hypothetical protein
MTMNRNLTLALTLLAFSASSFADATASTTFSDLRISLIDITPGDEIAPTISFVQATGSFINTYASSADPYSSVLNNFYSGDGAVIAGQEQALQASAIGSVSGAAVSLAGSTRADGAVVVATTFANGSSGQYSEALSNAYLGDGGSSHFILGAGTSLTITGRFDLLVTSTSQHWDEFAQADALLLLQYLDGQQTYVTADIYAGESFGISHDSLSQTFSLTFDGSPDAVTEGQFFGRAYAYASSHDVAAVPEPSGFVLITLGLFALTFAGRKSAAGYARGCKSTTR